jgi:hypothetical protein
MEAVKEIYYAYLQSAASRRHSGRRADAMPASAPVAEMNQDAAANTSATQKNAAIESKAGGQDAVAPRPRPARRARC